MKKYIKFLVLLLIAAALFNCVSTQEKELSAEDQVIEVLKINLQAAIDEDLELYMETIHPESPVFGNTESIMIYLYENFDLDYELEEYKIQEITDETADVWVIQITKRMSGGEFRDN